VGYFIGPQKNKTTDFWFSGRDLCTSQTIGKGPYTKYTINLLTLAIKQKGKLGMPN